MAAGIVDVHYSVERWFAENWTSTEIQFEGQNKPDGETSWIQAHVLDHAGMVTRSQDYGADVLISINVFAATPRTVRQVAQEIEDDLRAGVITVYDETNKTTELGSLRLGEPAFKAPRAHGKLYAGTVDVRGVLIY